LKNIVELNADIVCLEELDNYWTFFQPELQNANYKSVYAPRPSLKASSWSGLKKDDGCGIFYNSSKFVLKEADTGSGIKNLDISLHIYL
jgi:CCR4-NOT transcription complex subunit 6